MRSNRRDTAHGTGGPRRGGRRASRWVAPLLGATALVSPSNATADDTAETLLVGAGVSVLLADVVFTVRDIIAVARDEHPGLGWGIAESVVNVPTTTALNVVTAVLAAGDDEDESLFAIAIAAPASWTGALTAHGLWASIDSEAHPGALFAISPILGVNMSCTMLAFGSTVAGRASHTPAAVLEVIGGVPGTVLGAVELARGETKQGWWIALTAWSGTIFTHGLVSTIISGADEDDYEEEEEEWEPPEPPPPPESPLQQQPPPPPPRRSPDMVQAAQIHLLPTVLMDMRGKEAPGAAVVGTF